MSSPKIIIKSGYIKSVTHALNILEYSGNKIAAQTVVFADGSKMTVDKEDIIRLNKAEQEQVSGIEVTFKDGGSHVITYRQYRTFVNESRKAIRVDELTSVLDEEVYVNDEGKQYHAMKDLDFFKYLSYIEARPGVEKVHGHGLFGLTGDISIEDAKDLALKHEKSIKWSHIISLPEEDSARLGYNTRDAWANLIKAKAPQIAKAYNISLSNLVINAAYHSNTDNDHCHLLFYSRDEREGYVKGGKQGLQKASERLKSLFVNEIYRNDLAPVKAMKNEQEQELKAQLKVLLNRLERPSYAPPEAVTDKLIELTKSILPLKGKREYGYLPAGIKQQVDDILRTVVQDDKIIQELYNRYMDTNRQLVSSYYADPAKIDERMKLIEASFFSPSKYQFRQLHNIIVRAAASLEEQLPDAERASNEGENRAYRESGENASLFADSEHDFFAGGTVSSFERLDDPEEFPASSEGKNVRYYGAGEKSRETENNGMSKSCRTLYRQMQSQMRKSTLKNAEMGGHMIRLCNQLAGIKERSYNALTSQQKAMVNKLVAMLVDGAKAEPDVIDQLIKSNKSLHNAVIKFAAAFKQHRFLHDFSSSIYSSLRDNACIEGNVKTALLELNRQLAQLKDPDVPFKQLPDTAKEMINDVVTQLLVTQKIPPEVRAWFVPPGEHTPLSLHNMIRRYAAHYYEHQFIQTHRQSFYRTLADSTVNRTSDTYTRLAYIRGRLSAYPPDARYDALNEADKAEIIRIAYAVLRHPVDPSERNVHNIIARKLLLDEYAPKDLQNTVVYVAKNLDKISAQTAEYQRREKINAAFAAIQMCVSLGHALAQMSNDNHTTQQGQRNETKLERSFKHRKKEKYQNIAEY